MDNDWKSDVAVMSPFIVLFLSFGDVSAIS